MTNLYNKKCPKCGTDFTGKTGKCPVCIGKGRIKPISIMGMKHESYSLGFIDATTGGFISA